MAGDANTILTETEYDDARSILGGNFKKVQDDWRMKFDSTFVKPKPKHNDGDDDNDDDGDHHDGSDSDANADDDDKDDDDKTSGPNAKTSVDVFPPCAAKGNCHTEFSKFERAVAEESTNIMCRWIRADAKVNGCTKTKPKDATPVTSEGHIVLSLWHLCIDGEDKHLSDPSRFALLAHGLLQPYRCIMVFSIRIV
jgi:hypothetical protein